MDDKVNYTVVGAFVVLLGAALVAGVLWLAAGAHGGKRYGTYQTIMRESVSGLNVDAPVKYLGVDVGKVKEIAIDTADSSRVRLRFLIEQGTPIKMDTEAVLKTQGLTGIAYVELSGGTADSPPPLHGPCQRGPDVDEPERHFRRGQPGRPEADAGGHRGADPHAGSAAGRARERHRRRGAHGPQHRACERASRSSGRPGRDGRRFG